jgi:hypothetical protein
MPGVSPAAKAATAKITAILIVAQALLPNAA